jgi:hypothetical protein
MIKMSDNVNPWQVKSWTSRKKLAKILRDKAMRMDDWDKADKVLEDARLLERESERDGDLICPF